MILSDFLSRLKHNDGDPCKIVPISFNMYGILQEKYYNMGNSVKYVVQTWSQAKSSGIMIAVLNEHYSNVKALDTLNPELFQLQMASEEMVSDWGCTPWGTSKSLWPHS